MSLNVACHKVLSAAPMQALAVEMIDADGVTRCRLFFSDREVEHFEGLAGRVLHATRDFTLVGLRQTENSPPEVDMRPHRHMVSAEHLQIVSGEVEVVDLGHRLHPGEHITFPAGQMHHLVAREWMGQRAYFTATWRPALKECAAVG